MRLRVLLLAVSIPMVAATVFLLSRVPGHPPKQVTRPAANGSASSNPAVLAPADVPGTDRSGRLDRAPVGRAPETPSSAPFVDEGPPGHLRIDGTIRRLDGTIWVGDGTIWVRSGLIGVGLDQPDSSSSSEVIDGRFRLWVREAGEYRITSLRLGNETYEGTLPPRTLAEGSTWDVVAVPSRLVTITVLDDETGAPLATALAVSEGWGGPQPKSPEELEEDRPVGDPTPLDRLQENPPVSLPRPEDLEASASRADALGHLVLPPTWAPWVIATVGAPDHEWRSVEFNLSEAESVTVRLRRGGSIDVTVRPWSVLARLQVVAMPDKGPVVSVPVDADGHGARDGLASGAWTLYVIDRLRDPVVSQSTVVVPGEQTRVTLDLPAAEVDQNPGLSLRPRVDLKGTFRLPSAWLDEEDPPNVRVELLGGDPVNGPTHLWFAMRRSESSSHEFALDDVPVGRYLVTIEGVPWAGSLEVTASAEPVIIDVPSPAPLEVRVIDAGDKSPVSGAQLSWVPRVNSRELTYGRTHADGNATLRVPAGTPGLLRIRARGYLEPDVVPANLIGPPSGLSDGLLDRRLVNGVIVGPKPVRLEIPLRRAATILLRFVGTRGETVGDHQCIPMLRSIVEENSETMPTMVFPSSLSGGENEFWVDAGSWMLLIQMPSTFEGFAPQTVEAHLGETTEVQVRLVPRR